MKWLPDGPGAEIGESGMLRLSDCVCRVHARSCLGYATRVMLQWLGLSVCAPCLAAVGAFNLVAVFRRTQTQFI